MKKPASVVIAQRVLLQFTRDRRTFAMLLAVPFVITFIFSSAVSGEIRNAPVLIVNEDIGTEVSNPPSQDITIKISNIIIEELKDDERLKITNLEEVSESSWEDAKSDVDKGKYYAAIYFPQNFSAILANSSSSESTAIILYVDPTEAKTRASVNTAIFEIMRSLEQEVPQEMQMEAAKFNTMEVLANEGQDLDSYDIAIPAIIAFVLNFLVLIITTLTLTRENTYRTRTRLFTTPIRPADAVLGYALAMSVFAAMMAIVVLLVGTLLFGATVQGNWLLLLLAIILYGTVFVFLGVLLSTQARNELQAVQMGPLIALPSMALSGFLVPVESLPEILQPFSDVIPLTYGIRILKGIMLKDYGFVNLWFEFAVIGVFCVIFLGLALLAIKEEE